MSLILDKPQRENHSGGQDLSESSNAAATAQQQRVRRRNRMITSCLECRRRKLKCDKGHPCSNCTKIGRECVFLAPSLDSASQLKIIAIKEKVGSLERMLEAEIASKSQDSPEHPGRVIPGQNEDAYNSHGPIPRDENDLEPTPLAMIDATYDEDCDDETLDMGYMLGRMHLSERIGGYFRPKMAEELDATLKNARPDHPPEKNTTPQPYAPPQPPPNHITPDSGFFFNLLGSQTSIFDHLPTKGAADRLLAQYYLACHPIIKIVHKPSFDVLFASFWNCVSQNIEPAGSTQALVFAMMFMAVISMDDSDVSTEFGVTKSSLVDSLRQGVEAALTRANFLRSTKVATLQAFVMYLIPLCRDAVSRAHSALMGTAIRIAECMGLHRDGNTYGLSSVDTHVRRLIWFQLCFLDLRTVEAQGPRPQIRHDSFDTQFPPSLNEDDLIAQVVPNKSRSGWTDMTLAIIRIECAEMSRSVWFDRPRIEKKQISITAVLAKIEAFNKAMHEKYSFLDLKVPIQHFARMYFEVMYSRMHIGVLHRYHNSVATPIPDRLRQIVLTSGTNYMEIFMKMQTMPEMHQWAWYSGAFCQWHVAFLLLVEIWMYPRRKEADRIWACLDYVFCCDPNLSRDAKAKKVLAEVRDKSAAIQAMRKMRIPAGLEQRLGTSKAQAEQAEAAQNIPTPKQPKQPHRLEAQTSSHQLPTPDFPFEVPGMEIRYSGVAEGELLVNSAASPNPSVQSGGTYTSMSSTASTAYDPNSSGSVHNLNIPLGASTGPSSASPDPPAAPEDMVLDIDWNEWDKLFPPEKNDGILNLPDDVPFDLGYQPTFTL